MLADLYGDSYRLRDGLVGLFCLLAVRVWIEAGGPANPTQARYLKPIKVYGGVVLLLALGYAILVESRR